MGCSHSDIFPDNLSTSSLQVKDMDEHKNNASFQFTPGEVDLIQSSWKSVGNSKELGMMIMVKLFIQYPDAKTVWIFAKDLTKEAEIRKNPHVSYHAAKIIDKFDSFIANLSQVSTSEITQLVELGKRHYDFFVKEKYFKSFENCLINCLDRKISNKKVFSMDCELAWRKFFWTIVGRLMHGMQIAEKEDK